MYVSVKMVTNIKMEFVLNCMWSVVNKEHIKLITFVLDVIKDAYLVFLLIFVMSVIQMDIEWLEEDAIKPVEMEGLQVGKRVMMEIHIVMMDVHQHALKKQDINAMVDHLFVALFVEMELLLDMNNVMMEIW